MLSSVCYCLSHYIGVPIDAKALLRPLARTQDSIVHDFQQNPRENSIPSVRQCQKACNRRFIVIVYEKNVENKDYSISSW